VTEPVDIGFGEGNTTILDLGFAFRAVEGASYGREHFILAAPFPPELLADGHATTALPFKVDSWHLGLCVRLPPIGAGQLLTFKKMYFILTDGDEFLSLWQLFQETSGPSSLLELYERSYTTLANGCAQMTELIPDDLREGFRPILLSLLCRDPSQRASVEEIAGNEWLMDGEAHCLLPPDQPFSAR
jgi:serine/threonine protein kinase